MASVNLNKIKEKVDVLLQENLYSSSVDVFVLAVNMGLRLKVLDSENIFKIVKEKEPIEAKGVEKNEILGFLDKDQNIIYINEDSNNSLNRKRFTVAHELGHIYLHSDIAKNQCRKVFITKDLLSPSENEEVEANYFAGYLLMPDKEVTRMLPQILGISASFEELLQLLAKWFQVSTSAMRIRLKTFRDEHSELWHKLNIDKLIS